MNYTEKMYTRDRDPRLKKYIIPRFVNFENLVDKGIIFEGTEQKEVICRKQYRDGKYFYRIPIVKSSKYYPDSELFYGARSFIVKNISWFHADNYTYDFYLEGMSEYKTKFDTPDIQLGTIFPFCELIQFQDIRLFAFSKNKDIELPDDITICFDRPYFISRLDFSHYLFVLQNYMKFYISNICGTKLFGVCGKAGYFAFDDRIDGNDIIQDYNIHYCEENIERINQETERIYNLYQKIADLDDTK